MKLNNTEITVLIKKIPLSHDLKEKLFSKSVLNYKEKGLIWDICTDEISLYFDKDYQLTEEGCILQKSIDKLTTNEQGQNNV